MHSLALTLLHPLAVQKRTVCVDVPRYRVANCILGCTLFLSTFSILVDAAEHEPWCAPDGKEQFTFEWLEPNTKDLDERTLVIKYRKTGEVFTQIKGSVSNYSESRDNYLIRDFNFDGCPDISWNAWVNGWGERGDNVFLYDNKNKNFVKSAQLSDLPNLDVDPLKRQLISSWREDNDLHSYVKRYRWLNKKLVLVEAQSSDIQPDRSSVDRCWKRINGKMREIRNAGCY